MTFCFVAWKPFIRFVISIIIIFYTHFRFPFRSNASLFVCFVAAVSLRSLSNLWFCESTQEAHGCSFMLALGFIAVKQTSIGFCVPFLVFVMKCARGECISTLQFIVQILLLHSSLASWKYLQSVLKTLACSCRFIYVCISLCASKLWDFLNVSQYFKRMRTN